MKCEKSRKRPLVVVWGMKQLAKGASFQDVTQAMHRLRRKPLAEIEKITREATNENSL
jgi:hypothetical protein